MLGCVAVFDSWPCIQCGYQLPIEGDASAAIQSAGASNCPECGLSASRSVEAWASCGSRAAALERVGREASVLAVPIGFLALGWSFEWVLTIIAPTISLANLALTIPLAPMLNVPLLVASCVISILWWRMTTRAHPWNGAPGLRRAQMRASAWCVLCALALCVEMAPVWVMIQSATLLGWWPDDVSLVAVMVPLLPFATGWVALRLMPPVPMKHSRHTARWMRRSAIATIALSAALAFGYVGGRIAWSFANGTGGVVVISPALQLIFDATLMLSAVALPLALLGVWMTLLALAAQSTRGAPHGAPRSGALLTVIGAVAIVGMLITKLAFDIVTDGAPVAHVPALSELTAALHDFLIAPTGRPQATVALFTVGIVLLWAVAARAPGFVMRKAQQRRARLAVA